MRRRRWGEWLIYYFISHIKLFNVFFFYANKFPITINSSQTIALYREITKYCWFCFRSNWRLFCGHVKVGRLNYLGSPCESATTKRVQLRLESRADWTDTSAMQTHSPNRTRRRSFGSTTTIMPTSTPTPTTPIRRAILHLKVWVWRTPHIRPISVFELCMHASKCRF